MRIDLRPAPASVKFTSHQPELNLYSYILKIGQLILTRSYTVGSPVIVNAMALRPEPLCTPVLPQCASVLKLAGANY